VFQQDSAPAHRARKTAVSVDNEDSRLFHPNSPDSNPVDYKVWSVMQEKVCKGQIADVDELCSRILTDKLDQRISDMAVRQ